MVPILNLLFRARTTILIAFVGVLVPVLALVAFKPSKYEAHMSFLVRNKRADPLVSAEPHENEVPHGDVTEEEINSEVELLGSSQLLREVVLACGLSKSSASESGRQQGEAIERATQKLSKSLIITPVRKSSIINVSYRSTDRDGSVAVLNELATRYLQEHAKLHTGGTATLFFRNRSSMIESQLKAAEEQRATFLEDHAYTLIPEQKDLMVQQMLEVSKERDDADTSLVETESRLHQVTGQQKALPLRIQTLDRASAHQLTVEQLNTMLVELQNRRTELVTKFHADDPLVTEMDQKIRDTQAALTRAEQSHSNDTTTDINPLRQSLDTESQHLLEARAGFVSRRSDLDTQMKEKRVELAKLEKASTYIDDLNRDIKELESNLDLYRSKAVAAGIADDLDAAKISNVVVAAAPIVPVLRQSSPLNVFTAVLLAILVSLAIGLFAEVQSKRLYGPSALEAETGLPVLAALPTKPALLAT